MEFRERQRFLPFNFKRSKNNLAVWEEASGLYDEASRRYDIIHHVTKYISCCPK